MSCRRSAHWAVPYRGLAYGLLILKTFTVQKGGSGQIPKKRFKNENSNTVSANRQPAIAGARQNLKIRLLGIIQRNKSQVLARFLPLGSEGQACIRPLTEKSSQRKFAIITPPLRAVTADPACGYVARCNIWSDAVGFCGPRDRS